MDMALDELLSEVWRLIGQHVEMPDTALFTKPCEAIFLLCANAWFDVLLTQTKQGEYTSEAAYQKAFPHKAQWQQTLAEALLDYDIHSRLRVIQGAQAPLGGERESYIYNPFLVSFLRQLQLAWPAGGAPTGERLKKAVENYPFIFTGAASPVALPGFKAAKEVMAKHREEYHAVWSLLPALTSRPQRLDTVIAAQKKGENPWMYTWPLKDGWTLYHYLTAHSVVDCVKRMMASCQELLGFLSIIPSPQGWRPTTLTQCLIAGVQKNHRDLVEVCVQLGAEVTHRSSTGKHALHYAAAAGGTEMVELLLPHLPVNRGPDLWGALHQALKAPTSVAVVDLLATVKLLLDNGADPKERDINGDTPLHLAARRGDDELLQCLLAAGADFSVANEAGDLPLHCAAANNHKSLYRRLLYAGSDRHHRNKAGKKAVRCCPKSERAAFKEYHRQWDGVMRQQAKLLKTLSSASDLRELDNVEEWQEKAQRLGEPQIQYKLACHYERQRDWASAALWANYAAEQGHGPGRRLQFRMESYINKEKQYKTLLSTVTPPEDPPFTQEHRLQRAITALVEPIPIEESVSGLRSLIDKLPLWDQPVNIITHLQDALMWLGVYRQCALEGACLDESSELNELFRQRLKAWSAIVKTESPLAQQLWQFFQVNILKKQSFSSNNLNFSVVGLFTVVLPSVLRDITVCLGALQPKVKRGTRWVNAVRLLNRLQRDITGVLNKRLAQQNYDVLGEMALLYCSLSGVGLLKMAAANKLIPIEGPVQRENEHGMHTVLQLPSVHYKKLDKTYAAPGVEMAVNAWNTLVANTGSPPTTLLKVRRGQRQHIYQASYTIEGMDMLSVLTMHPELLGRLDPRSFSAQCLLSIFMLPRDGKPDNIMGAFDVAVAGTVDKLRLVSIDNDLAFGRPLVKRVDDYCSQVRTFIWLLPAMDHPIENTLREDFLALSPINVCLQWLEKLYEFNEAIAEQMAQGIFTSEELSGDPRKDAPSLELPLCLPKGTIVGLYQIFVRMQEQLQNHPNMTHQELLIAVRPLLGHLYGYFRRHATGADVGEQVLNGLDRIWCPSYETLVIEEAIPAELRATIPTLPPGEAIDGKTMETIESSAAALTEALDMRALSSMQQHLYLTQIPLRVPFIEDLTLVGGRLAPAHVMSLLKGLPVLSQLTLKGVCDWKIDDITYISGRYLDLKLIFAGEDDCLPLPRQQCLTLLKEGLPRCDVRLDDVRYPLCAYPTSLLWHSLENGNRLVEWYEVLLEAGAELTPQGEATPLSVIQGWPEGCAPLAALFEQYSASSPGFSSSQSAPAADRSPLGSPGMGRVAPLSVLFPKAASRGLSPSPNRSEEASPSGRPHP